MVPIEENGSSDVSRHHCENFTIQEKLFNHLDPNEKEKEISKSPETTQNMVQDEGNLDQGEFHTDFIPTWCLNASDDNFLCGEDLPGHPSMIIQGDESIDNINTLDVMTQSKTTIID